VFVYHAGIVDAYALGNLAMFGFFALSGYLITAPLINEHWKYGAISLRGFFARRALRILPALGALLVVWVAVVAIFHDASWINTVPRSTASGGVAVSDAIRGAFGATAFATNWQKIGSMFNGAMPLGHLWSLAVEMQLYFFWAPVMALLLRFRPKWLVPVALALAAASMTEMMLMAAHGADPKRIYMGTDTRAAAFMLGAAFAALWTNGTLRRPGWFTSVAIWGSIIAALWWAAWTLQNPTSLTMSNTAWLTATIGASVVVVGLSGALRDPLKPLLGFAPLRYVGTRSYALYLWHYVYLTWFHAMGVRGIVLAGAASLATAEASWRLVEHRAIAFARRFGHKPRTAPQPEVATSSA
jgi:peptidoglycan/LPS O-acetylase OafA/YrhL